jgi:hypothetical protein
MDLNLPQNVEVEEERDIIGGAAILPSNVYKGVVELVYLDAASSGAISVNINFKTDSGRNVRQTVYISNKKKEFFYTNKDNKNLPLPGYSQMDAFFKSVTGKGIADQNKEDKVINLYNREAKKEIPQTRTVFMDTINKPAAVGILEVSEEITTKESDYKQGTGEYRQFNELHKWFDPDNGLTNVEKAAGETEPKVLANWKKTYEGKLQTRNAPEKASGTPGAPKPANKPTESLFSTP